MPCSGTLFILLASVLWGTTGTSQTLLPEGVSSLSVGAVRLAIGSLTLVSFILLTGGFHLTPAWSWKTAFFAGGGSALYQLTFFSGLRLTGVAVGTIVAMGSTPIFAAVLDYFLQKEKLTARWYIATLVSLTGGVLLVLGGSQELKANPLGILLALVAGFSYAVLALANKRLVASHPPFTVMAVNSTIGALLISPLLFTSDLSWLANPAQPGGGPAPGDDHHRPGLRRLCQGAATGFGAQRRHADPGGTAHGSPAGHPGGR